jgi:hypothetical protein
MTPVTVHVLENVTTTIRMLKERGFWVEIVTLLIPGFNDSDEELTRLAEFIASPMACIPWHVTAFHKDYKMTGAEDTTSEDLLKAVDEDNLMSDPSPSITVNTKPLPQKPSGLIVTEKEGRKLLQWNANPEKDVKEYAVYKKGFLGISQKLPWSKKTPGRSRVT